MLCCIIVLSRQIQLQMPCLASLRKIFTLSHCEAFFLRIWASPFELDFHFFEPCPHISGSYISKSHSHVYKPHSFGPHLINSLYFFDPDLAILGPCFWNTCPISVIPMQRILKWASWRTYKDNGCNMKLSCRAIKKRQLGPKNQIIRTRDNQDSTSWIRRLGKLGWGLILSRFHIVWSQKACLLAKNIIDLCDGLVTATQH